MPISFVAFDFETANSTRSSACALGMTKVIDGKIVDQMSAKFKPPEGFDHFDYRNISIHGISEKEVADKDRFGSYWNNFAEFAKGFPLVAHNASFDMSVLRASLRASNLGWPEIDYVCTYVMSQKVFSLTSYSLFFVAYECGIKLDKDSHHDARYDSEICAKVLLDIFRRKDCDDLSTLMKSVDMEIGHLFEDSWYACRSRSSIRSPNRSRDEKRLKVGEVKINLDASTEHPLFGKKVVFTGALYSMPRHEAWELVAAVGAIPMDTISKSTDYLVLGEQILLNLKPGEVQSGKFRKAESLRESGLSIQVISETDFLAILEPQQGTD